MKKGLVMIGHGSRSKDAETAFHQVVDMVKGKGAYDIVAGAFMELTEPNIPDTVDNVVKQGAEEIILVPYFLYDGIHIKEDIPQIIEELSAKHAGIKFVFARPIGPEPVLADIVLARAKAADEDALS